MSLGKLRNFIAPLRPCAIQSEAYRQWQKRGSPSGTPGVDWEVAHALQSHRNKNRAQAAIVLSVVLWVLSFFMSQSLLTPAIPESALATLSEDRWPTRPSTSPATTVPAFWARP